MSGFDGHTEHYSAGNIEVIDIIEAFELDFSLGNAVKYILRAGRKSPDRVSDLEKARAYIDREIARLRDIGGLSELARYEQRL